MAMTAAKAAHCGLENFLTIDAFANLVETAIVYKDTLPTRNRAIA